MVEIRFATHGDVGEVLLNGEDIAAHFLDPIFVDAFQRRCRIDEDRGHQMTQAVDMNIADYMY